MELKAIRFRACSTDRFSGSRVAADYLKLYHLLHACRSVENSTSSCNLIPSLERKSDHERIT
jgi:hypothetical protein